ncbi:hypothetical protein GCM10011348_43760 [Marinobacterium nitratireducens]|uniref:Peptidase M50 domain-containing protein n=2 Tax=Marinobacterium nitratireducens TaxID=518897 RepID=A0A917ZP00_9GAMM|nr:hypothetical protein GCM10011348_43760 [Marinobacterium nitratireducens]
MDGTRTVDEIWDIACQQLETDAITQDEMIALLGRLHTADVLLGDIPPDIAELSERGRKMKRQKLVRSILNPLAVRIPLLDPDDFLRATLPLVRPLLSWLGALILLALVLYGATLAVLHWSELSENVVDRVLAFDNLLLLFLAYPVVKALHELGHAYTLKRWGGDVHEIGIMFLVFMPVPYVDASDSIAFHSKWQRALVASAGILTEMLLAALAMIVWVNAEEGLVRALAFNVMLIGGVSTLLFNGNPLLRFDGYYVLCDLLEIPNLGTRANRYLGYLIQRYAFGMEEADSPATSVREGYWMFGYAVASFLYRLFITFAIVVLLVSSKLFAVGILLAVWAVFLMLVLPLLKQLRFLLTGPALRRRRGRALAVTAAFLAALGVLLFLVPTPHYTLAQGYVATGEEAAVNARADGVIAELLVAPGAELAAGAPILRLEDPLQPARLNMLRARIDELKLRLQADLVSDQAAAIIAREELEQAEADIEDARQRAEDLVVRAPVAGRLVLARPSDLVGRFVHRGDLLAHVAEFRDPLIRVLVPERRADLVRRRTESVDVRFARAPGDIHVARIVRDAPALSSLVPSLALSTEGGGDIALDPAAPGHDRALQHLLHLDLKLQDAPSVETYGDRVYARFYHGNEPMAARLYRGAMQVFLRFFNQ